MSVGLSTHEASRRLLRQQSTCLVTDISATVAPIGVKFCLMVHMCPGCVFPLLGEVPPWDPPNQKFAHPVLCLDNALV